MIHITFIYNKYTFILNLLQLKISR